MIIPILLAVGCSIAIGFYLSQSVGEQKKVVVDVIEVIDGQTLAVKDSTGQFRVLLAGIGFPAGDERAALDSLDIVKDVCLGKKFYMVTHKELDGLKYVNLLSGSDESLNELLLKQGFARYASGGVGYISSLVAAESEAKLKKIGIWDKNRELYRNISNSNNENFDQLNDATESASKIDSEH